MVKLGFELIQIVAPAYREIGLLRSPHEVSHLADLRSYRLDEVLTWPVAGDLLSLLKTRFSNSWNEPTLVANLRCSRSVVSLFPGVDVMISKERVVVACFSNARESRSRGSVLLTSCSH